MPYDEVICQQFGNGAFMAMHPLFKCILKVVPSDELPDRFVKEDKDTPHYVCTDFVFKPALRRTFLPDDPERTFEDVFLDYVFGKVNEENASVSFSKDVTVGRLDFIHRLERFGFKRNKKTKSVYLRLIDPDAHLDVLTPKQKERAAKRAQRESEQAAEAEPVKEAEQEPAEEQAPAAETAPAKEAEQAPAAETEQESAAKQPSD